MVLSSGVSFLETVDVKSVVLARLAINWSPKLTCFTINAMG
jgi:hypothetical protein